MLLYPPMSSPRLDLALHLIEVLAAIVIATFAVVGFFQPAGHFPRWAWTVLVIGGLAVLTIGARLIYQAWRPVSFIRSYVEPFDTKLMFSPKFRVELRNDSGRCIDIETSKWLEGQPLSHNSPRQTWQVYRAGKWIPSPEGDVKVHAHAGELVRTWMIFKDMSENEVENGRRNRRLGKLEVLVNDHRLQFKL